VYADCRITNSQSEAGKYEIYAPFYARTPIGWIPVGISKKREDSGLSTNQKCPQFSGLIKL